MPTGLYVIGSNALLDGVRRSNLMTASLVMQVSVEPKLLAASIDAGSVTHRLISHSGSFSVSLLRRNDRPLVRKFVKAVTEVTVDDRGRLDTMAGEPVFEVEHGVPVLQRSIAWLHCTLQHRLELGSHVLFIGEVSACGCEDGSGGRMEVLRMEDTRMNYGG